MKLGDRMVNWFVPESHQKNQREMATIAASDTAAWRLTVTGCSGLRKSSMAPTGAGNATIAAHVFFNGHRHETNSVAAAPSIQFNGEAASTLIVVRPAAEWYLLPSRIQVCLVGTDFADQRALIGSAWIDWRRHLLMPDPVGAPHGQEEVFGSDGRDAVGVLTFTLEAVPALARGEQQALWAQCDQFAQHVRQTRQAFGDYVGRWWADYVQLRPRHKHAIVRVFAGSEVGGGDEQLVCNWLQPLASRDLPSPQHALRFVSLLADPLGAGAAGQPSVERWRCTASVLAAQRASPIERALLLCSLFLGFGLCVYVGFGKDVQQDPAALVVVIDPRSPENTEIYDANSGTVAPPTATNHRFYTVDCLFSSTEFLANRQASNLLADVSFDVRDGALWKPLKQSACKSCRQGSVLVQPVTLRPSRALVSTCDLEQTIEARLADLITQFRANSRLQCRFDSRLAHVMSIAACDLETAHVYSSALHAEPRIFDSQRAALRKSVASLLPPGHSFRSHRVACGNVTNPGRLFQLLLGPDSAAVAVGKPPRGPAAEILLSRGERVRFAVRVHVAPFLERVVSVWVVLAVAFSSAPVQ